MTNYRSTPPTSSSEPMLTADGMLRTLVLGILGLLVYAEFGHRPTYEYQTVSPSDSAFDTDMNRLGAQGWKTESCRRATSGGDYSTTASYECIMSRPKTWW